MRIQFTIDEVLGNKLQREARELGLSVSSFVRHIIKKSLKGQTLNAVDKAVLEQSEPITIEEFKRQLGLDHYEK
ncbi:MAG: hypothetical protein K0R14_441 [Burkholderiales bacterium]|jgi:hypothetical protein|nr:hypothetical protein [Burkholderiales bacterium]